MYTVDEIYFKKDEIFQIYKIGPHVFYLYWFLYNFYLFCSVDSYGNIL